MLPHSAGAKLKDASIIGYIIRYDLTLHNRYKVWMPASDNIFSCMSMYMHEDGAYMTPTFLMPIFLVGITIPMSLFLLPSAMAEGNGASNNESMLKGVLKNLILNMPTALSLPPLVIPPLSAANVLPVPL